MAAVPTVVADSVVDFEISVVLRLAASLEVLHAKPPIAVPPEMP